MTKKFVTTSIFVLLALVLGVGVVSLLNSKNTGTAQNQKTISDSANLSPQTMLSLTELQKHNSNQSCWLLISGKIYDVTSYINSHPGGSQAITFSCGQDATEAFNTQGGQGSHSKSATAMLADFYIGDLNQTVNVVTPPASNSASQTSQSGSGRFRGGDDDEFDD